MSDKEKSQKLYDLGAQAANLYLFDEAIDYLEKAAELDNAEAMYLLGSIYQKRELENETKAFKWYKKAADNGYQKAFIEVALFYLEEDNLEHNKRAAEKWFNLAINRNKFAAENGDPFAMKAIADDCSNFYFQRDLRYGYFFELFDKNPQAEKWYKLAFATFKNLAKKGNVDAMFELSWLYRFGEGTPENRQESIRWLNTAAKVEDVQIKIRAYRGIAEFSDDHQDAETFYKKAAELGDFISMIKLYDYYNTEKNFTEAKRWWKKSKEAQAEFLSSLQQEKF